MPDKKVIALLPMKGHSERVPNKNMKLFAGRPLYHAVMRTLSNSPMVSKIIINTDSEIIAGDAEEHFPKVEIHWRPEELRGDMVAMNKIIGHDLEKCGEGHYIQTHSTNPLLETGTLNKAIGQYFKKLSEFDSLFSVTRLQTRLYWEDGRPVNHNPDELLRTQDLPPLFEENSNFYIFSRQSFLQNAEKRIGKKPQMFEQNKMEAVDIDYPEDFALAEVLMQQRL